MALKRSCVVCRREEQQQNLLRFAVEAGKEKGAVCFDVLQVLDGRGAYCHVTEECLLYKKLAERLKASLLKGGRRKGPAGVKREGFSAGCLNVELLIKNAAAELADKQRFSSERRKKLQGNVLKAYEILEKSKDRVLSKPQKSSQIRL